MTPIAWILAGVVAIELVAFSVAAIGLRRLARREDPMDVPPDLADMHELAGGRLPEIRIPTRELERAVRDDLGGV